MTERASHCNWSLLKLLIVSFFATCFPIGLANLVCFFSPSGLLAYMDHWPAQKSRQKHQTEFEYVGCAGL